MTNRSYEIDIHSQRPGVAGRLSNLTLRPFILGGKFFASIEGFLQSLKVKDWKDAERIAGMHGIQAKVEGSKIPVKNQTLYWNGNPFNRHSEYYKNLLLEAYKNALFQNDQFQKDIYATMNCTFTHVIGKTDPNDTILTESEFISCLYALRLYLKPALEHIEVKCEVLP